MEQEKLLELIERSRQGDRPAQDALVREAEKKIYYHCKKMLKNEEDAQDATQDVLIAMITSLDKLREPDAFWGWVNGITANRCKHLLSNPHKEWQIPEDEEGNSMLDSMEDIDEQRIPDKALDNEETRRMIIGLVDDLPPEQRMSVLFYYYDEMSVKQIAEAMETSEGTVKSRLNYARKSIKNGVEDYERKGVKLYGVSPLLLLLYFLRTDAEASALDSAAVSALAERVMAQIGGTAAATAAVGAAAGTTSAGTAATAAAGTAVKAGISTKLIAGIVAGAIAIGGAAVGITAMVNRNMEAPEPTPTAIVETTPDPTPTPTPEPTPEPTPTPFAVEYDFSIVQPQAYESMEGNQSCSLEEAVFFPVTYSISKPEVSVSEPDENGYVTYTITYQDSGEVHFGLPFSRNGYGAFTFSRWSQGYELYDYYTGLYLPCDDLYSTPEQTDSLEASVTIEHGGRQFEVYLSKSLQTVSESGGIWSEIGGGAAASDGEELYWDFQWSNVMSCILVIRAPADYDGLLLGINLVDVCEVDGSSGHEAQYWDLNEKAPSHYEFFRLVHD